VILNWVSGLSLLLAIGSLILYYLSGGNSFDNSDALYLPTLFRDVLQQGGQFKDWYLTPAPYYFPDYGLYFLAFLLVSGIYEQIIVFTIIQCFILFGLVYVLTKQIDQISAFQIASCITICLVWFAVTVDQPFIFLLISAHHYGAFISAILLVYLWNVYESKNKKPFFLLGLISIVTFLSTLSDNLFLIQALLPFFIACIASHFFSNSFQIKGLASSFLYPFFFGIAGSISYKWLVVYQTRYSGHTGFDQFSKNINDLILMAGNIVSKNYILLAIILLYLILCACLIWQLLQGKGIAWVSKKLLFLSLFSLASIGVTFAAVSLVEQMPVSERYLISAYTWPVIMVGLFAAAYFGQRAQFGICLMSALIAISLCFSGVHQLNKLGYVGKNYSPELACLDDALQYEELHNGVAQYWDAKALQAFSRLELKLAQHFGDLSEHRWITSANYFRDRYDFVIISTNAQPQYKITREQVIALNGLPRKEYICGHRILLIYGKDQLRVK